MCEQEQGQQVGTPEPQVAGEGQVTEPRNEQEAPATALEDQEPGQPASEQPAEQPEPEAVGQDATEAMPPVESPDAPIADAPAADEQQG
jgi:hypothetical protein